MISNWFRVSLRILFKYRLYTGISLVGLAIAITSVWFIANYVTNSYGYDAYQDHADRIHRLSMQITAGGNTDRYATTGKPLGSVLAENYSGIDNYARLTFQGNPVVWVNDELFKEDGFYAINPEGLGVFTFDFISGNTNAPLSDPNSILLSRSLAEKYFGGTEVVNKPITIGDRPYTIQGVFEDWPKNSHVNPKALLHSEGLASDYELQEWFNLEHYTYVLLDGSMDPKELDDQLAQLTTEHLKPGLEGSGVDIKFLAQPLKGLFFAPGLIDDVPKGNSKYVYALLFAGLLVLLIAGLNAINLSLTQSTQRTKEIQLKKMLGISRGQLVLQSAMESGIMTVLVLLVAGILVLAFNTTYFQYSGFQALDITGQWLLLLGIPLITFGFGLLGTSYSGVYLSFSGNLVSTKKTSVNTFKKVLLGFQFAIASIIIIATLTINKQIDFMKNKDLGFSKEQVMIVDLPGNDDLKDKHIQFRERVKSFPTIQNASLIGGGALPGEENGKEIFQVTVEGEEVEKVFNFYRVDENFSELLELQLALGRNFEANRPSDKEDAVLINQALAQSLQWENPLDQTIYYYGKPRKVIGVVQNFHNKSLHNAIEPIVFLYDEAYATKLLVKTAMGNVGLVETAWADFFPNTPFALSHFDQFIDAQYIQEDDLAKLLGFFSLVSLGLCCMGLFAIFSLHLLQKTKELSIRKVLGANAWHLVRTTTRSYVGVAVLALGMAIPVAWYLMENWLTGFSYRISMDALVFIGAATLILGMSGLTVLYHILKSVHANPVASLQSE
ncbi:ABC transporter permease [Ulvibacterium marinum]|uniref:ABC transporter permease n=1 Tax=Ulvibacterium marinum TaxID=2419782 RepID=UPI002494496B|nr:ABC transporter permease [Ulvibacterium marinum]